MPSVTITSVTKNGDGSVTVVVGKRTRVYGSVAALKAAVRSNLTVDDLIDLALALALFRQPALGNPSAFDGHTVSVDFTAANWGTIS